jgi:putative mycofactocin binding protein MftB
MNLKLETRYKLAPGSQVREEDFGLLFYTMAGPRLYFLSCGGLLGSGFFNGELTLETEIRQNTGGNSVPETVLQNLKDSLNQLHGKGVIIER